MQESKSVSKKVTIVTHSSGFHTDDIFAVATLFLVLGEENVSVIRSRDIDIIEKGDYVVDVGGVYDPGKNQFDHHQIGGAGKRSNEIPYASFGLIWKKFGEDLCGNKEGADKIDESVVQPIDALDNGIQFLETRIGGLHSFDVGFITFLFYPTFKEDLTQMGSIFLKLVSCAKVLLQRIIKVKIDNHEGEKLVLEIYNDSKDKRLILMESSRYPWEEVLSKLPEPLYGVYKNINNDTWSIKAVRNDMFTYSTRKMLPETWAGKTGEELEKVTGVSGAVFCHTARFMAVAKTKEAIIKLAEIALNS